jgi:Uma2 family endonuclease
MMQTDTDMVAAGSRRMVRAARSKTLYEAIEALPEGVTGEIIDGQLHTQPRPAGIHGLAAFNLGGVLRDPYTRGRSGPGGWWIVPEPELHFMRDAEILVPDLAGWRRERMPAVPQDQRFEIVPDWVCEILSPSTRSKDREIKMPVYARYGVRHAWLIDPHTRTLETYELEQGQWQARAAFAAEDHVAAAPFELAAFLAAELWS